MQSGDPFVNMTDGRYLVRLVFPWTRGEFVRVTVQDGDRVLFQMSRPISGGVLAKYGLWIAPAVRFLHEITDRINRGT